ncbi:MAG: PA2169 family four-helix-bundle protein [Opitutaceae bacterium]|nr:PA2169 family four-helix-bundle protein [Opitutaceae bacterium]
MPSLSPTEDNRKELAAQLSSLVAVCRDAEAGYKAAAEGTTDLELQALFSRLSRQRGDFADELQQAIDRLGCPVRDGSLTGALYRGWLGLKAALLRNEVHALLSQCEEGEDEAVAAYRKALADPAVTGDHHVMINSQSIAIKLAHDEIKGLRDHPAYRPDAA